MTYVWVQMHPLADVPIPGPSLLIRPNRMIGTKSRTGQKASFSYNDPVTGATNNVQFITDREEHCF